MTTAERLRDKANSLPLTPGVYLMKDSGGKVIYVGKSKKLKNRVTSYFTGNHHTAKTSRMVSLVSDFDYIVCDTEIEALTLENVLIKKYTPRYNIKLKDAKSYPYIKVSSGAYPRLYVSRERRGDRARYYGPYSGISQAYAALETVTRIFSLPPCKRQFPRDIGKERPCLYLSMGRCIGVCTGKVSEEDYRARVKMAEAVLGGDIRDTVKGLREEMFAAAEREEFERAAAVRDSIAALEGLLEKQKVVADVGVNRDVFALYTSECDAVLAMLCVRGGAVIGKQEFPLSDPTLTSPEDILPLLVSHYDGQENLPREILLDFPLPEDDLSLLSDYLSVDAGHRVTVRVPERGSGRALCDLALENARETARQNRLSGERENRNLIKLREILALPVLPRRVEAYDISNIGNEAITASMVVCEDGKLRKSEYRLFTIRTTDGADDYGSMREILTRRLSHLGDGSPSLGTAPDLILLDGGDAHVHVGREVLDALGLSIPLFGMVKDDFHKTRALTDGEHEISIAKITDVYTFIYNIQEEAHRFAVKNSQGAKVKAMTHSTLEKIPGIGPAKARAMLRALPLADIRRADADTLAALPGIGLRDAEAVVTYFAKNKKS